eukprot:COSAG06_NODE_2835_length_6201_cov_127.447722_6_plen_139_part_00
MRNTAGSCLSQACPASILQIINVKLSGSREAYRYQRNSCCFSTGGFAKLNRLEGQTEEQQQQQQQEQGQEEEQERAAALSFVPCHVGNFHGQRWAFGPDLTTALRNANAQSVAQMRRCGKLLFLQPFPSKHDQFTKTG